MRASPLRPALSTSLAKTPSPTAGLILAEIEHGFAQLGYPASIVIGAGDAA